MVLGDEGGLSMKPPPVHSRFIGSHYAIARHKHHHCQGEKHKPRHRCNPLEYVAYVADTAAFIICYYLLLKNTYRLRAIIEDAPDSQPQSTQAHKAQDH